jgi:predicted DNA-binding transcriptional regulator YafY
MKSDRLLALLLALQRTSKAPATALAEQLEVSVRTIYRDVDALSAAGIPVYAERGSRGGIVLADTYRDTLSRLSDDEVHGLFVSSDDTLSDLGLTDGRRSALDKLARATPGRAGDTLRRTRGRVHIDARRWNGGASVPAAAPLSALRDALWNDRSVTIAYMDRKGAVTRRTIDPLGLVAKAGVWYLIARDRETIKTFRAQRIARVRVLQRHFTRPPGFNAGEYWQSVSARIAPEGPRFVATFRMTRRALANALVYSDVESRARVRGSTPASWDVRIAFPLIEAAVHEAVNWGDDAIALDAEVRRRVAARVRALGVIYAPEPAL